MEKSYQTIIIGGGVAGMTAALYLKRAGINILIIEKEIPGGQITKTANIENYPGFSNISGTDLAMNMYKQLTDLEIPFLFTEGTKIERIETGYKIITSKTDLDCQNIIIATGRTPRKLEVENEDKLTGTGISWCAVCDGPLYKNKEVAVIGGGTAALEESLYLSKICSHVTLIHRRNEFRAVDTLVERVKKNPNITLIANQTITRFIEQDGKLSGVELQDAKGNREIQLVEGCFEYIGQIPNTENFKELEILDREGYIEVDENYETKLENVYAIGDCLRKELYQIVTACNDGVIVANHIITKEQ